MSRKAFTPGFEYGGIDDGFAVPAGGVEGIAVSLDFRHVYAAAEAYVHAPEVAGIFAFLSPRKCGSSRKDKGYRDEGEFFHIHKFESYPNRVFANVKLF